MVERITVDEFVRMVDRFHYSKVLPKLNKYYLGDRELRAVMSLGWGVRPLHTIKKLFPELGVADYVEIGRMCADDDMPRNTESKFISRVMSYIKRNDQSVKVVFTWADGMLGKPGYVYQASNFLYGGYIWTDTYISENGEKIHPRMTNKIGGRPTFKELRELGWRHFRGKQFRYIYFLCSKREQQSLIQSSPTQWSRQYPKSDSLEWYERTDDGWEKCAGVPYQQQASGFSDNTIRLRNRARQGLLFGDFGNMQGLNL